MEILDTIYDGAAGAEEDKFFYAYFGVMSSLVLGNLGAAIGTAGSIGGLLWGDKFEWNNLAMAVMTVVVSGILGFYGVLVSVMLTGLINDNLSIRESYSILGAGLTNGISAVLSGLAIGVIALGAIKAFADPAIFANT